MNFLTASLKLMTRSRQHKLNLAHLDERFLNDIGLCWHDLRHTGTMRKYNDR